MELSSKLYRKSNSFFEEQDSLLIEECHQRESSAKNMLIRLAEVENISTFPSRSVAVNGWLQEDIALDEPKEKVFTQHKSFRRTSPFFRQASSAKYHLQVNAEEYYDKNLKHFNKSMIPKLKSILKHLESPTKKNQIKPVQQEQKRKKTEYLQKRIKKNNESVLVSHLMTKRNSLKLKNPQTNQNKCIKLINYNNLIDCKPKSQYHKQRMVHRSTDKENHDKKYFFGDTELVLKEARKNRTLKNILF